MSGPIGASARSSMSSPSLSSSLQNAQSSSMESLESSYSTTESAPGDGDATRMSYVLQENNILKSEVELLKNKVSTLTSENLSLKANSVSIQALAEQEEEYISNKLLKKIQILKKEKEVLAMNYEQEEEFLTNDLQRKLDKLRQEKLQLEQALDHEMQDNQVANLMKKVTDLEAITKSKQKDLDRLKHEKVELENALEQEQEMLVNKLYKQMEKVEKEKRELEEKLGRVSSPSSSPGRASHVQDHKSSTGSNSSMDESTQLVVRCRGLESEVRHLKRLLMENESRQSTRLAHLEFEEKGLRDQNMLLLKRLRREMERSEALCRTLSESESSLEMEEEKIFNENRARCASPTVPYSPSPTRRTLSPATYAHVTSLAPTFSRTGSLGSSNPNSANNSVRRTYSNDVPKPVRNKKETMM